MFHYFGTCQNTKGDALAGWFAEVVDSSGTVVPIYADAAGTVPIIAVSGVANRAKADDYGNYDFFVASGTYSIKFYNSDGVFQRTISTLSMYGASSFSGGPLISGQWVRLPAIYKLLLGGTGTVTIDTRDRAGTVTTGAVSYSPSGFAEAYPYFGSAYEVRATLTGSATAEIV